MKRALLTLLFLLFPLTGLAATFASDQELTLTEPVPDNAYIAGANVSVSTDLPADLTVAGGSVGIYAPVAGDVLATGGTVVIERPVGGDVRAAAGKIHISSDVAGDVAAAGGTVIVSGKARGVYIFGGTVQVTGGASGPVTLYGSDITLTGDFTGDVEIIASDHFTVGENTHIAGALRYNAPEQAAIPPSAVIDGGTTYTGSYSYVPTKEEARKFAIAGAGLFLVVRTIAGMIVAGLLVGLFPLFAGRIADMALTSGGRRTALFMLLGFALFVATPLLVLLLLLSFVGAGIALLLGILYLLLLLLSYVFAGVIAGSALRRHALARLSSRTEITWRDAVLGVLVLNVVGIVPVIGPLVKFLLAIAAAGILATLAYRFAFRSQESE
jgi:cytoskeletal protein CcmA (bactofilin family)